MGIVYRATDRLTGQTVALKQIGLAPANLVFNTMQWEEDRTLALAHEFQVLASLRHPHIVSVQDYGFSEQGPFFTMSLLEGAEPISRACRNRSTAERLALLQQMLHALHYLHQRGILHRDLKPDNVLVVGDSVYVLDFGLAIAESSPNAQPVGTLAYMSPEILMNKPPSHTSDLYAAGVIAYECLVGRFPYRLGPLTTDLIHDILYAAPKLEAIADSDLAALVGALLAKDPAQRPPHAYRVLERLAALQDAPPLDNPALRESLIQAATLVGRETELTRLQDALHHAAHGQGGFWLVGGESGVGKSRLMNEVQIHARVRGMQVLAGQATAHLPYAIWQEPLRHLTLLTPNITEREWQVIRALVPDVVGAPEGSNLASGPQIQQTILDLLSRQPVPTLLLLEDLHEISAESLAIVQAISEQVPEWAVAVIGTYRTDIAPSLPTYIAADHYLPLRRLTADQTAALSQAILGEAPPTLIDLLQRETEGNTFFLVEAVHALAERAGGLHAVAHMPAPEAIVTGGMQAVIERRLAQVPPAYQDMLKLAAVVGRALDPTLMRQLVDGDTLGGFLYAAEPVLEVSGEQWQFAHEKLREAVLAQLTPTERPTLFRQVAEVMDTVYAGNTTPQAARRAVYWMEAGDTVNAWRAYNDAGTYFLRLGLYQQALGYFESAMPLSTEPLQQAFIYNEYGRIYTRLGQPEASLAALQEAVRLADGDTDRHRRTRAFAYGVMSQVLTRLDRYQEALYVLREALAINRTLGLEQRVGENLLQIGQTQMDMGAFAEAIQHMQEGIDIAARLDRHTLGYALSNLALLHTMQGHLSQATTIYAEALGIAREVGHRTGEAARLLGLGDVWRQRGQFGLAHQYIEEGTAIADGGQYRDLQIDGRVQASQVAMDEGRLDDAHQLIEAAQAFAADVVVPVHYWMSIPRLAILEGDNHTVIEWSQQFWDAFVQQGRSGWLPFAVVPLAWGLLMQGKVDEAHDRLAHVVPEDQTLHRALTASLLAVAQYARGDDPAPTLHLARRRADALIRANPDHLGAYLAWGLALEVAGEWQAANAAYTEASPLPGLRRQVEAYRLLLDTLGG